MKVKIDTTPEEYAELLSAIASNQVTVNSKYEHYVYDLETQITNLKTELVKLKEQIKEGK